MVRFVSVEGICNQLQSVGNAPGRGVAVSLGGDGRAIA